MRCAATTWSLSVLPDEPPPPNKSSQNMVSIEWWAFVQEGIRVLETHLHDSHNGQHK